LTVLVVVPDYASHWYPLSAVADALRVRGHRIVVATGQTLAPLIAADAHEYVELTLGSGSNGGVRPAGADIEMDAFFAATRDGMIATLRHQAERRRHDLLWEPEVVANRLGHIVQTIEPDVVLVDQLAFGATAALRGLRVPFLSFLPGHPCQLPVRGELFGYPGLRPPGFAPPPNELRSLRDLCAVVTAEFTATYNAAITALNPTTTPVDDAFAAGGTLGTIVNYSGEIGSHSARLPDATFVGSCVRLQDCDPFFAGLAQASNVRPRAYVSLGSFLSARTDVLQRIAEALRILGWDAVIASGVNEPEKLGPTPEGWVVRRHLPQVAALAACDIVICHGGNNTVTEALTAGLPVLAAPFSTDQFAGAEDLRRAGLGHAIDPNAATPAEIAARLVSLLDDGAKERTAALGRNLRCTPGAELAASAVETATASRRLAA
jgi:MGT family glycosyltransferase